MEKPKRRPRKKTKLSLVDEPILSEKNIELLSNEGFDKINLDDKAADSNSFINKREILNRNFISANEDKFENLYPSLDDSEFNIKIALKKEFNETKYDGTIFSVDEIEEQAKKLCEADFELSPNQLFVRNFLSFQTPYNSLLLYHGLGSGKTCSAISVSEEMRDYLKQLGITQRIIVVASPNVQENFKLQLFDDRKLKLIDGLWNLRACTGNKYLKEINPMNMKGLSKEKVIRQIKRIINNSYLFLGYTEFANYIQNISKVTEENPKKKKNEEIRKLKKHFSNRLIIIDEVHNIRISTEKQDKRIAQELMKLVSYVDNLRLLFLSATPMYNSYKEIIWLLNIMNKNDKRSTIELKDVFDQNGNLLIGPDGSNVGEELIKRKSTGYVSFVRGENPYTFPYRIFPSLFSIQNTFKQLTYPGKQLNGKEILQPLEHLDVYVTNCGSFQQLGYNYIIDSIKEKASNKKEGLPSFENLDTFGYTILQKPLQALNMLYPTKLLQDESPKFDSKILLGTEGLKRCMKWKETTNPPSRNNFEYKNDDFGKIFSPENIGEYSGKIKNIVDNIYNSDGIVLIYSQFIDGGVIPMALALESIGFTRFGNKASNLFKTSQHPVIDSKTYLPKDKMDNPEEFRPATYTLLTGEKALSPDKVYDLKNLTDEDNKNGEKIKVIIISMTGSEGLDFKNLRQVHIMEPWYNLSLVEQIIGRAVRNCSHKQLPFKERNVEIFLYGTLLNNEDDEAVDLYIYRIAEMKAVQIGRVSRILKESSVDCLLNIDQTLFTEENMNTIVKQQLSNKMIIDYPIGDKAKTVSCDYMDTCDFKCKPFKQITEEEIKLDTYNEAFILINTDKIIQRIRNLFKQRFFYKKDTLISEINVERNYPLIQINVALTSLINDRNDYLIDKYDRLGRLINIDEYYLFQPIELTNENISVFDRRVPIDYKADMISLPINMNVEEIKIADNIIDIPNGDIEVKESINVIENKEVLDRIKENYNTGTSDIKTVKRGEDDWYLYLASIKSNDILKNDVGIDDEMFDIFLLRHILEKLSFNENFEILNYIYFKDKLDELEIKIKKYYDDKLLVNKGVKGMILSKKNLKLNKNSQILLVLGSKSWNEGKQEDYTDLIPSIKKLIIPLSDYNLYVGFMGPFKDEEINIFKVKNMDDKRSKGARCDQSGKSDAVKLLNNIVGKDQDDNVKYTPSYIKGINKTEFCVLQEMYLRYFNETNKNNKRWFLSPEESIINDLEKIHLNK
jgi:hypothetical protein|tara:strand:- start:582 stop:4310 length:3729 start_codon:yes stop_codon:yes gene_type:complete